MISKVREEFIHVEIRLKRIITKEDHHEDKSYPSSLRVSSPRLNKKRKITLLTITRKMKIWLDIY